MSFPPHRVSYWGTGPRNPSTGGPSRRSNVSRSSHPSGTGEPSRGSSGRASGRNSGRGSGGGSSGSGGEEDQQRRAYERSLTERLIERQGCIMLPDHQFIPGQVVEVVDEAIEFDRTRREGPLMKEFKMLTWQFNLMYNTNYTAAKIRDLMIDSHVLELLQPDMAFIIGESVGIGEEIEPNEQGIKSMAPNKQCPCAYCKALYGPASKSCSCKYCKRTSGGGSGSVGGSGRGSDFGGSGRPGGSSFAGAGTRLGGSSVGTGQGSGRGASISRPQSSLRNSQY
ncbi:MAG: hypothetical protein M1814_004602 [Vezdaea aestivalis]|nr:MAG: hypothetical protein M1814_004602 [Vezdaea aestivalis]